MVHIAFTACVLGLTVFNYFSARRNVLYPPFLFSLIWLVVLCLYMVPLVELYPLEADTLTIIVCSVAAFTAGALLSRWWHIRAAIPHPSRNSLKKAFFFCCLAVLPLFFLEIRRMSFVSGAEGFLLGARTALLDAMINGESRYSSPVYTFAITLSIFVAFIFLIEVRDWSKERLWVWGSILVAVIFAALTTGRTSLMELTVGLSAIFLLKWRRFSLGTAWKFIRWPVAALLVLSLVLVAFTKVLAEEEGVGGIFTRLIYSYAVGPLAGFNYIIHHPAEYKYDPHHTFAPILVAFDLTKKQPPNTLLAPKDFVYTPAIPTNVFTAFRYFYADFGFFGMLVVFSLLGAGHTWLFRKALTGDHLYIFLFALSLYPLAMVYFDDAYAQILTLSYLKQPLFAVLYFRVLRGVQV